MARLYQATFHNITLTNSMDLIGLYQAVVSTAANAVQGTVLRWWAGSSDNTLNTAQMLNTQACVLLKTVTAGSGGTTPTPTKYDAGDAAAVLTAHANDTTVATTSGTLNVVDEETWHLYNGYDSSVQGLPPVPIPYTITAGGTVFAWRINSTAVQGSPKGSGGVTFQEASLGT